MLDCKDHIASDCAALIRREFEASAALRLSAIILRMCGCSTPYLGVRGTAESNKSHGNELNESLKCGLCIKLSKDHMSN